MLHRNMKRILLIRLNFVNTPSGIAVLGVAPQQQKPRERRCARGAGRRLPEPGKC
jgi:hypothetical protein